MNFDNYDGKGVEWIYKSVEQRILASMAQMERELSKIEFQADINKYSDGDRWKIETYGIMLDMLSAILYNQPEAL